MDNLKKWFEALFAGTAVAGWWTLSALSTLSSFFLASLSGRWRIASALSAAVGFAWANFRVFQKQQRQISELKATIASRSAHLSELRISVSNGSRYVLLPVNNIPRADFNGMFVEFHLMIENAGARNSTVTDYTIEVMELRRIFSDLSPDEGRNGIQGRHCQHVVNRAAGLSNTGIIQIQAERSTNRGTLLFFLGGVTMQEFVNAGLQMHGEQRKFGTLHCRLTLTDTTGSSVTGDFQMDEA